FNPYFPPYFVLSPKGLGRGGAVSTAFDNPEAFFVNPATAAFARPGLSQSHSTRHFPGPKRNLDQLDADAVTLTFPGGPFALALAFTVEGELGYDYRVRNDERFPQEQYQGKEVVRGSARRLAFFGTGASVRTFHYLFNASGFKPVSISGEGHSSGILFQWFPWLSTAAATENATTDGLPWDHMTRERKGWSLRLFPWLLVAGDREVRMFNSLGLAHSVRSDSFTGWEARLLPFMTLRNGNFAGHPTVGFSVGGATTSIDYAEVIGLLPDIVRAPLPNFKDVHIHGYTLYR
ncbi:MAG: hypothetical protein ACREJQ_04300, partial [bacterium]